MYFFLDIDDTLIPPDQSLAQTNRTPHPLSVAIINVLAKMTNARIVLISSRAHYTQKQPIVDWLRSSGLTAPFAVDWKIGENYLSPTALSRAAGIHDYLKRHVLSPEQCLILDDIDSNYRSEGLGERFIQPAFTRSLDMKDFERAGKILGLTQLQMAEARSQLQQVIHRTQGAAGDLPARG